MDQALYQQNVLVLNSQLVAEKDFEQRRFTLLALLIARLDEGADHRHFQCPHQVGDEHETVLQDAQRDQRLTTVVVGNLVPEFANSLLDLVGGNDLAQGGVGRSSHDEVAPPERGIVTALGTWQLAFSYELRAAS